jgi:hypothetical protein
MRSPKPSDSPSGFNREVYPLRGVRVRVDMHEYVRHVAAEVDRLLAQNPGLDGEDPRALFSRMVTPETLPDYSSCLRRAAFGVLLVRAQHRAELADPSTGGEAA